MDNGSFRTRDVVKVVAVIVALFAFLVAMVAFVVGMLIPAVIAALD